MKIKRTTIIFLSLTMLLTIISGMARAQFNTNTSVNMEISGLNDADHHSAATTDGKMWIAFFRQIGSTYNLMAQLLDASGNKLLGPDGIIVSSQPTGTSLYVFNVCIDASNNLIIGCQDIRTGSDIAVVYKIAEDGTQLWGSTGIVLGAGLAPYPGVLSNGETVIAWSESIGNTLNMQKIKTNGTIAWATPISVLVGTTKTIRGQVVPTLNGTFTLVFQKKSYGISSTIYAQRYDTSGTALAALPIKLSTVTTSNTSYCSVLADGDTTYVGYYGSVLSRYNSYLQRIDPTVTTPWGMNGSNFCTSIGGSDYYQMLTTINMTPGSNYIWSFSNFANSSQDQYGIYVQKFLKTTGARQFTDLAKNLVPVSATRHQHKGVPIMVGDAPIYQEYEDVNYKIFAARLDVNGNFVWPGNSIELSAGGSPKMRNEFGPAGPNRCVGIWTENRGVMDRGYAQDISLNGLIGVVVATQGGVSDTITTPGGTLQMVATVFPANASQNVTWSIIPDTGTASIDTTGLITAGTDGNVWAKATSVVDPTVKDSMMVTISQPLKTINITLYLEGLYAGGGLMNQASNGSSPQYGTGIADQVTVELHDAATGALEYSLANMNLSTAGVITGSVPVVHNGNYYIYIIHRNSITVSTATPVSFAGSSISYDFSIGVSQAFGSNMKDINGVAVAFAGEATQDCGIDSSDMIAVDNDNATFASGYIVTDINGDGGVDSSDMILVDNNNAAFIGCVLPF